MLAQFENRVVSSMLLFIDNCVCTKGAAFTNFASLLYPMNSVYNNFYTYSAPFKSFMYDNSISGANIITGLYLNGTFVGTGTSGLHSIDYDQGRAYFTGKLPTSTVVSGSYALRDFNVMLTNQSDAYLLFETKYEIRPRITRTVTGLAGDVQTYPLIWLKDDGGTNVGMALGGLDNTTINMRAFVLSDSQFKLDAVFSILKDTARRNVALLDDSEFPLNSYGNLKNPTFNYTGLCTGRVSSKMVYIDRVDCTKFNLRSQDHTELLKINPEVHVGILDFEVSQPRYPRI